VRNARFRNGGNSTHWPYGGGFIEYRKGYPWNNGSVFLPAVLPPPPGPDGVRPKDGPTSLSATKIRVFSPHGGNETWMLPLSWVGKTIHCRAIGDGAVAPIVVLSGRKLQLKGMPIQTPVVLTVSGADPAPGPISARTPALGWSSWNYYETSVNESVLLATADALISTGLAAAGYTSVNIDAGWGQLPRSIQRDANGRLVADKVKFPRGIKFVCDELHEKGLHCGLYGDVSGMGVGPRFRGHETLDMQTFADWGVDYVKADFMGYTIGPSEGGRLSIDPGVQYEAWQTLGSALNATTRKMWFSLCPRANASESMAWHPPPPPPGKTVAMYSPPLQWTKAQRHALGGANANSLLVEYGNTVDGWDGCDTCRESDPIKDVGLIHGIDAGIAATNMSFGTSGSFNDMDMLQLCNFGEGSNARRLTGMNLSEYRLEYSVWSIMASNLILGTNVITIAERHPECLKLALNKDIIGVNQDEAAFPPRLVYSVPPMAPDVTSKMITQQVLARPLSRNRTAVLLLNRGAAASRMVVTWEQLGLAAGGSFTVRDVIAQEDTGATVESNYSATVQPHDVSFVILAPISQ